MHLYLVRHGQSIGNVHFLPGVVRPMTDPLTEIGLQQAQQAAEILKSQTVKPEIIVSSPYTRALDTARTIQEALKIPLAQDVRLGEYKPGDWDGTHIDEFTERFNSITPRERYIFRPPNGESWLDEANRIHEVIKQAEDNHHTCLVIVSHFDPIKATINLLTEQPFTAWGVSVEYPPGSVTALHKAHSSWTLVQLR